MSKKQSDTRIVHSSQWCDYIEKHLDAGDGLGVQPYYGVVCRDYLSVVAQTPSGLFPLVYQYRAVVEKTTCELPAGTVESGETIEQAAMRELKEETGLKVSKMIYLGSHCSDSGRLTNRIHSFFANTNEPDPSFRPETGMRVEYVDRDELLRRAVSGEIDQLLHLGTLFLSMRELGSSDFR